MNNSKQLSLALLSTILIGSSATALAQDDHARAQRDAEKAMETETAVRARNLVATAALTQQCFTFGSPAGSADDRLGKTFLKVCITNHGNISYFESPSGQVHISGPREGYAVCSGISGYVHGFDVGMAESNWSEPKMVQPNGPGTLPIKITRTSLDGRVELRRSPSSPRTAPYRSAWMSGI